MRGKELLVFRSVVLLLLTLSVGVIGQTMTPTSAMLAPLSFGGGNDVGATSGDALAAVAGDLDSDGDDDLVSGDATGAIRVWQNDGSPFIGLWPSKTAGNCGDDVYALALVDLDHDGNLDLVSGCGSGAAFEIVVWRNDGSPFAGGWSANSVGGAASVLALAVGDLDSDGNPDIVSGDTSAVIGSWRNDGTPFTGLWGTYQMIGNTTNATNALGLADLDNDGDLDIASGDANKRIRVWQNDGSPFAGVWTANEAWVNKDAVNTLALADLDGDGDVDIVADMEYPSATDYRVAAWQNDGSPFSGSWSATIVGSSDDAVNSVALGDLDSDGAVDVVAGSGSGASNEILGWYSPAAPFAGSWTQDVVGASTDDVNSVALGDFDRDGDLDVASGSGSAEDYEIIVWRNKHTPEAFGSWVEVMQPSPAYDAWGVALADFDHDGATDVAAGHSKKGLLVWRGNGGSVWDRVGSSDLPDSDGWRAVAWGQINNRREVDLAAASSTGGLRAWHAWEAGGAWDDRSTGLPGSGDYYAVALGDLDHSGLPDLVAGGNAVGVGIWQGSGSSWTLKKTLKSSESYCDLRLGHVNHDGDLDIVAANCKGGGVPVWLGDGGFGFSAATAPATTGAYTAIALGDVNRDGFPDIAAAPGSGGVQVWAGDGGGSWTSLSAPPGSLTIYSLDLADFDRDGYLDLLAATKGNGLRVWRGNGGVSWTDTSTGLPATGTFYDADFGLVDGDAALDIVATEVGSTGVRVWTAFEPPPSGWDNFRPVGWVNSQVISATIEVADAGSGLNVSTAEYRFSRDGGATWVGGWLPAACSGADGVTTTQVITAASVPFNQDSATLNAIQFRVSDLKGLTGTSPSYNVTIDSTAPTNPTGLSSTSHTVGTWDNDPTILFTWADTGTDNLSGVDGYSFDLTQNPTERPDEVLDRDAGPPSLLVSEHASADGDWYWHFMTRDNAHNWSAPTHLGPYRIDTGPPTVPTLVSSSHTIGGWSNDNTIWIDWSASDGGGSGVAGYSYRWTRSAGSSAGTGIDIIGSSMTSSPLNPDGHWYLHILAIDQAGSAGDTAHIGPFNLDTTPPTSSASSSASVSGLSFTVNWVGSDGDGSDSLRYDVQYRDGAGGTWTDWRTNTASTSAVFAGQHGHIYDFRSRARDQVGNEEAWPSVPDTTTRVATLDFEGFALEVTQAVQDLNNSVVLVSGKRAFVRFHIRSLAHGNQGPVSARLRGWRGPTYLGAILANNPGGTITVLTDPDRGQLDESFYFDLPSSWLRGSVHLNAEANHDDRFAESDTTNNFQITDVTFQDTPEMNILMVDACYTEGGTTYHVRNDDRRALASWLRRAYPIHRLNVWWRVFSPCYDHVPDSDEVNDDLEWNHDRGVLGSGEDPYTRYYGLVDDGYWRTLPTGSACWMRGSANGIPSTEASGPAGRPDRCATWDTDDSYADWYGGHELGHTYNRYHAEFCDARGGRPFPYPNGDISPTRNEADPDALYGFDVETLTVYPPDWKELMTYCDYEWMSDITYQGIRNRMVSESGLMATRVRPAATQEYLAVFGAIYTATDQVEMGTFYRVADAWDIHGRVPGDYSIRLLDAGNGTLADYAFTPKARHVDPGASYQVSVQAEEVPARISEYVPWVMGTARIAIYHGGQELASRSVSDHAPQVTLTTPNGGEVLDGSQISVTWTASDADGDALDFTLEYSADAGAHWRALGSGITTTNLLLDAGGIPGTDQGKFRILASDGVNTGQDESDGTFTVPNKAPDAQIVSPPGGATYVPDQSVALVADVVDLEDGTLDGPALAWTSSLSGTVGSGQMLHVTDFITGTHVITLTATDSDGSSSTDEVILFMGVSLPNKVYLPVVLKH